MSKNLIKSANYDAFDGIKDSALANSAFAIADENGVIVSYKDESGEITMFQGGDKYVEPKHYYAVMSDGTKVKLDGMTSFTPTSAQKSTLVSIELPSTMTTFSLSGCYNLESANADEFPNVMTMNNCFRSCYSLTSISLPSLPNVTYMGGCFYCCRSLTSISLPSLPNVTRMDSCFELCKSLTSISLPELPKVNYMDYCFNYCSSLESLTIGAFGTSLTDLSNCCLSYCTKLSVDSLVNVLNALPTFTSGSHTCTIGSTNLAKLSEEQIAIATAKNWTLN